MSNQNDQPLNNYDDDSKQLRDIASRDKEIGEALGRIRREIQMYADSMRQINDNFEQELSSLRTECHNFADTWTRKIEALESTVDPAEIRHEMTTLIAEFVRLTKKS